LFLSLTLGAWSPACALPVYFVVTETESSHGDSYVLPLEEPEDIHHARDLIARGSDAGATIVLARIAEGADDVNRNVLAPGEPSWSWHIEEFLGFADFTIEIFDGWPTFVEEDVRGWIDNTGGIIGFWQYTVTAELKSVREPGTVGLLSVLLLVLGGLVTYRPDGRSLI
jgi:hypothetical protein